MTEHACADVSSTKDNLLEGSDEISDIKKQEHDTLKYHLLGPSLTKAGQDSVDQSKVLCASAKCDTVRLMPFS